MVEAEKKKAEPEIYGVMRRFSDLRAKRLEWERQAKDIKGEEAQLAERILKWFAESGTERVRVGGKTYAPRRQIWACNADGSTSEDLTKALISEGLVEMCTAHWQRLSSFVRECEREQQELPVRVKPHVGISERFDVSVTKV